MKITIETEREEYVVHGDKITTQDDFLVIVKNENVTHMFRKKIINLIKINYEDETQVPRKTANSGQLEVPLKT